MDARPAQGVPIACFPDSGSHKGAETVTIIAVLRVVDALGLCQFCLQMGDPPFLAWLNAATG